MVDVGPPAGHPLADEKTLSGEAVQRRHQRRVGEVGETVVDIVHDESVRNLARPYRAHDPGLQGPEQRTGTLEIVAHHRSLRSSRWPRRMYYNSVV